MKAVTIFQSSKNPHSYQCKKSTVVEGMGLDVPLGQTINVKCFCWNDITENTMRHCWRCNKLWFWVQSEPWRYCWECQKELTPEVRDYFKKEYPDG